jgi:uncharacterized hydrophobic protein (TIGR00271 family)
MKRTMQKKMQRLIGMPEDRIQEVAEELFASTEQHPAVYWIYLAISAGIAFFGLVMSSTAVVIGAMLVSPLMTPLVQTGMAFAMGNLYLALRSLIRVILSTLGVVIFAVLTTVILPFEQITPEIAARTQPNALDLFVALFCAVVASLTTARQASDTVSAAAGTAISIALVPPLCVMGFGLGILDGHVFMGSTLLFIANLAAIILVSDLFFLLVGFARVNVSDLEEKVIGEREKTRLTYRFVKSLHIADRRALRWARLKIALPLFFVLAVALPLSNALSQVAWEVNTKKNINRVLSEFEKKYRILSRQQVIEGRKVSLRLTIVGDPEKREEVEEDLKVTLRTVMGEDPALSVDFIPLDEYVSRTFRTGSDFLNKLIATMERTAPILEATDRVASGGMAGHEEAARKTLQKTLEWLNTQPPAPQYYSWRYAFDPGGAGLTLYRIADDPLTDQALGLIASTIQRDTGMVVSVLEERLPQTICRFRYPVLSSRLSKDMDGPLEMIRGHDAVTARIRLKDPQLFRNVRAREVTARMNEVLLAYVRSRLPGGRVIIEEPGDEWVVSLSLKRGEDPSEDPQGQ